MASSSYSTSKGKRRLEPDELPVHGHDLPNVTGITPLYDYTSLSVTRPYNESQNIIATTNEAEPSTSSSTARQDNQAIWVISSDEEDNSTTTSRKTRVADNERVTTSSGTSTPVIYINDNDEEEEEEEDEAEVEFGRFTTNIVGLRYYTGMVGKRQSVIIERQPDNPYDTNALRAMNIAGEQIGHIARVHAAVFSPMIDRKCIRLEGICPIGTGRSNYQTRVDLIIYGPESLKEDVLAAFKRFSITLTPPPQRQIRQNINDLVSGSEVDRLSSQEIMTNLVASVQDLAKLPIHPAPPSPEEGSLNVRLLNHQLQGLAWMIQAEHPILPPISKGKSMATSNEPHTQFWTRRQDDNGVYYCNIATQSLQRTMPPLMRGGILADDMGLGKTMQAIALLLTDPSGAPVISSNSGSSVSADYNQSTLIVCPLSVIGNWETQLTTHVTPGRLTWYVYHGPQRNKNAQFLQEHSIVLTTYQTMAVDGNNSPLFSTRWRRVILDEGHLIKNPKTKLSQAAYNIKAERRWVLSGTPLTNQLNDLYSLLKFLDYKPFDNRTWYNVVLRNPIQRNDKQGFERLKILMQSLCIRRTKQMQADGKPLVDMPPCQVYEYKIPWNNDYQRNLYKQVERYSRRLFRRLTAQDDLMANYASILNMLVRMRQICDHPDLCPKDYIESLEAMHEQEQRQLNNDDDTAPPPPIDWTNPSIKRLIQLLKDAIESGEDCCICLEALRQGCITPCAHYYCRQCIERVIYTHPTCPMCRHPIRMGQLLELPPPSSTNDNDDNDDKDDDGILSQEEEEKEEEEEGAEEETTNRSSTKIDALLALLNASPKDVKSVVFSQWTTMLDKIEPHLKRAGIPFVRLDGTMSRKKREVVLAQFNLPISTTKEEPMILDEMPSKRHRSSAQGATRSIIPPIVLLISLQCGALGLNLTAASQVFIMDPWWNASIQDQAIDRVYRLGQTKPVNVFQLVIQDSIEEKVIQIQKKKRLLVAGAFDAIRHGNQPSQEIREMRIADIRAIFDE